MKLERIPFDSTRVDDFIHYSLSHSVPPVRTESRVRRFVTRLVSSPAQVIDLFHESRRVGAAALLDNIENPSNSACLEILALEQGEQRREIALRILQEAKGSLTSVRDGIEYAWTRDTGIPVEALEQTGWRRVYGVFDMRAELSAKVLSLPKVFRFGSVAGAAFSDYYRVLKTAFAKNPEASIPPIDEMKASFAQMKIPTLGLYEGNEMVGFLNVSIDENDPRLGHVNTIGILPELRGRGLGSQLIAECLRILRKHGADRFELCVAAENDRALQLYRSFGFETVESYDVYRWTPARPA